MSCVTLENNNALETSQLLVTQCTRNKTEPSENTGPAKEGRIGNYENNHFGNFDSDLLKARSLYEQL